MRILATLIAAGIVLAAGAAAAEIYRYSDANGTEHFVMSIEEVPEAYRAQALERAANASKRINIVGPKPRAEKPRAAGRRNLGRSNPGAAPRSPGSERHWRAQFASKRQAIESAERELQAAEAANTTQRAGHSSSVWSTQRRWAHAEKRQDRAEQRIERAEDKLEAAEDRMHELRQRAVAAGVPDAWMR